MLSNTFRAALVVLVAGTFTICAGPAQGEEGAAKSAAAGGPLAALPSPSQPHVERIQALGDNEWLNLGAPAADPQWGRARGRSWSSNMPGAADLAGAFVFAEGVHAYVKPDGHYMNDVWFYDIHAHGWICLYPGIEVKSIAARIKSRELTLNEHGLLVDKDGALLPPLLIHAYGYLGYDPDQRKFLFFGSQFGNYFTTGKGGVFEEANRLFEAERQGKKFRSYPRSSMTLLAGGSSASLSRKRRRGNRTGPTFWSMFPAASSSFTEARMACGISIRRSEPGKP